MILPRSSTCSSTKSSWTLPGRASAGKSASWGTTPGKRYLFRPPTHPLLRLSPTHLPTQPYLTVAHLNRLDLLYLLNAPIRLSTHPTYAPNALGDAPTHSSQPTYSSTQVSFSTNLPPIYPRFRFLQIQILPGIIARLDRDSPYYGSGYNDWNTLYITAASSTSGGSSGSPVLADDGKACALNCGAARNAASAFYLPLDRVKRALDLIIAAQERSNGGAALLTSSELVPRGTLLTIFKHKAYDELRRLGLATHTEASVRASFPQETGMLVVEQCLKNGPAEGMLEPGDVLLEVGGEACPTFLPLESYLDAHVGEKVALRIERGGQDKVVELHIRDLHALMPTHMYTISSAILHPMTIHMSKTYHLEAGTGVHLSSTGYMFSRAGITIHCIIVSVGGVPTPTIAALEKVFAALPDGTRTSVSYHSLTDRFRVRSAVVTVDKKWFACGRFVYAREERGNTLCWTFEKCKGSDDGSDTPAAVTATADATKPVSPAAPVPVPVVPPPPTAPPLLNTLSSMSSSPLKHALVMVSFNVPYLVDGMSGAAYIGAGIVIDKAQGLVLVDRSTAPTTLGDGLITFGGVLEVPAKCIFVHPLHNLAVLRYDAAFLEAEAEGGLLTVAEAQFAEEPALLVGESLVFHGLSPPFIPVTQKATITKKETLKLSDGRPPTFVSTNASVFHCDHAPGTNGLFQEAGGDSRVVALRLCYAYSHEGEVKQVYRSVSSEIAADTIKLLKGGGPPPATLDMLPLKFTQLQLAKVKAGMGLSETQFRRLGKKIQETESEASLLVVRRVPVELGGVLRTNDVLLSVDDEPVVRPFELERAMRPGKGNGGAPTTTQAKDATVVVLREHAEVALQVRTMPLSTLGTDRLVLWCGLMVQEAHLPVSFLGYKPPEGGVYVSRWHFGSPAHKHGLRASFFISSINDILTPNLSSFLATVTTTLHEAASIRVKGLDLDAKPKSYTLKTCYEYWPTTEIVFDHAAHEWQLHPFAAPPKTALHAA